MSLQVWLPLTGHTNNQGLSSFAFSNTATSMITVSSAGKLGQCYDFNSTATNSGIYSADNGFMATYINNHSWSMCAWVQTTATDTCVISLSYGLRMFAGSNTYVTLYNSSRAVNCYSSVNTTDGKWHHLIATYDVVSNKIQFYVDGICTATTNYTSGYTYASSWTNGLYIGRDPNNSTVSDHYLYKGKMNDVRIYNHALSAKEAHELSKALVLHYKLDDPFIEATTNLITTADPLSSTCYNGATNKYGYGANTDIYKETTTWEGQTGTKVHMGTNGLAANPYVYFSNLYTSNGTNSPAYKTISFDYYATRGTWLNIYKLGSGSGTCNWRNVTTGQSGSYTNSANAIVVVPNHWNHIEATFHGTTDADAQWGYCILGGQHTSDTNNFWFFANVQIETRDHATPYVGGPGITRAASLTAYDSSGYKYNGTPTNVETSTPSVRYGMCSSFNGTDSRIVVPYNAACPTNIFTLNLWWKKDALGSKGYETLFGGPSGFEMDTRAGSATTLCLYMASTRGGTLYSPLSLGQWYMFTLVRDGTNEFYYIDGALVKTIEAKSMPTGTYFIGAWSSATSQNYYGKIADFRLYNTPLSAADVLELYHTEAAVGRGGEVFAREVIER